MSVTARVTDGLGRSADAAATLSGRCARRRPTHRYDRDRILARPTLSEASFVDRLRAVDSPALGAAPAIYRRLVRAGVNPAFALGMFHAESQSGTLGYAVVTKNWGNILFYSWTRKYGATPYAPGNGYTYAKLPDLEGERAGAVRLVQSLLERRLSECRDDVGALAGGPRGQQASPALPEQHRRRDDHPARQRQARGDPAVRSREEPGRGRDQVVGDGQSRRDRLPGQAAQARPFVVRARGPDDAQHGPHAEVRHLDDRRARQGRGRELVGLAEGHRQGQALKPPRVAVAKVSVAAPDGTFSIGRELFPQFEEMRALGIHVQSDRVRVADPSPAYVDAALASLREACIELGVPEALVAFIETVDRPPRFGLRYGFQGGFTTDVPNQIWIFVNWTRIEELRRVVRHETAHLAFARTHTPEASAGHSGPSEDFALAFEAQALGSGWT